MNSPTALFATGTSSMAIFSTKSGLDLYADIVGDPNAPSVLFLHGGGQTRATWKSSLASVAALGFRGIAYDGRGHGESDWSPEGDYRLDAFASDLASVLDALRRPTILIGASLGGITSLLYLGEQQSTWVRGLVLVDVAPRINPTGVQRILDFMAANPEGFASIEEAAGAVRAYNPDRPRAPGTSGLAANLRKRNGRYFWHWDPAFLNDRRTERELLQSRLDAAARRITVPSLLIHAGRSDVVTETEVRHLQELVPHCRYQRIEKAGHMVSGDANTVFNAAIRDFLLGLPSAGSHPSDTTVKG